MKKILFLSFIFLMLITKNITVEASSSVQARIGNNFYDTLQEAINDAGPNDIISLTSNITLDNTMNIKKTVNLNLNNYNIKAKERVFLVEGGSLNLSGTGKIIEEEPYYGAIVMKGSTDQNDVDYSTVNVGSGITLEGWSGIFIDHNDDNNAYGILVNMNGDINAKDDIDGGPGAGIYVNGNIKHQNNSPVINLSDTVNITSTGNGIYSAGYATYNINGAYIEGKESGLGIKSGVFNIFDGTILGSGEDKTPTSGNNNGINASGVAIQLESNAGYAGDIELTIKKGTIKSINSNVIYEYVVNNTSTKVKNINLSGGNYVSDAKKDVFSLSDSFKNTHQGFISGGKYSSNPTDYLKGGYTTTKNSNSMYEVVSSTISVFKDSQENNKTTSLIVVIISIIVILSLLYLNRNRILKYFK